MNFRYDSGKEGAREENEAMHRRRLETANECIEEKLDRIIELLEELVSKPGVEIQIISQEDVGDLAYCLCNGPVQTTDGLCAWCGKKKRNIIR